MNNDGNGQRSGTAPEWENYIIPVFGTAIVVLILLVLCQFYSETWRRYCCPRALRNDVRNRQIRNHDGNDSDEDLPPSYSVLTHRRTNYNVFRVEAEDERSTITTITDKLPTYMEILEQQKRKKEAKQLEIANSSLPFQVPHDENILSSIENASREIEIYEVIDSEDDTLPAYRPRTAG